MMKKTGKTLAAFLFASVWLGIFYPEICFTQETCEVETLDGMRPDGVPGEIEAAEIWHASGDEIVISSRFWEWCKENLSVDKN